VCGERIGFEKIEKKQEKCVPAYIFGTLLTNDDNRPKLSKKHGNGV